MDIKDITAYLGIEAENIDDFKSKFSETYDKKGAADKEAVAQEVGRIRGAIDVAVKRLAKEHGVEFDPEELKDKKTEDIVGLSFKKMLANTDTAIQKVKDESRKSKPADIQEWESKVTKLNDKIGQLESTNNLLKDEMSKKEQEFLGTIKKTKLGLQEQSLWGGLKFRHDLDDLTKKGFISHIKENYRLDLDDKDALIITDKDGKFIPDTSKHGAFKSAQQVIMEEGLSKNIFEKNPDAGRRVELGIFVPKQNATTVAVPSQDKPLRHVSQRRG